MASINIRSVFIFFFISAIFVLQLLFITADGSGGFRTARYDPRTPPTPQANMMPPESSSPPPIYA
ncbi:hypothetical protein Hanom_Chr15g01387441 [Helianthus anomalus]